jgi:hypothetical protein
MSSLIFSRNTDIVESIPVSIRPPQVLVEHISPGIPTLRKWAR